MRALPVVKHLHIRGENALGIIEKRCCVETPPHTWRKSPIRTSTTGDIRNTSTYVEKIDSPEFANLSTGKHLHIRGENASLTLIGVISLETPPHTWRKYHVDPMGPNQTGNTSTYVEKIWRMSYEKHLRQKHLHIRGENMISCFFRVVVVETPPHTWRKSDFDRLCMRVSGNTSTYVEKIPSCFPGSLRLRNTSTYVEKILRR